MAPNLPKEYKAAVFEAKGEPLTFKQLPLELPKTGEVCPYSFESVYRLGVSTGTDIYQVLVKVLACGVRLSDSPSRDEI